MLQIAEQVGDSIRKGVADTTSESIHECGNGV